MSDQATAAAHDGAHDSGDHDAGGHGHDTDSPGPIDWRMWAVGVIGVIAALIVTAGFAAATSFAFNA